MTNNKKYVGNGKKAGDYDLVNISVKVSDPEFKAAVFEYKGEKYVKLTVAARREADQYGKTHTVYIDEFKPEEKQEDDLPF